MLKRYSVLFVLMAVVMLLTAPVMVDAAAPRYEGIYLYTSPRISLFEFEITATKVVDGWSRQSLVDISFPHSITCYEPAFDETVLLQEDPDELSVSRDLGWGGLHGWAVVHDLCSDTDMVMEFHVDLFANTAAIGYDPTTGYYSRESRLTGYILLDGELFRDFSAEPMGDYHEYAYSFSTREPYPRWD